MYLTVLGESRRERGRTTRPPAARSGSTQVVSHKSLLPWGEHCSDCAMPGCYASCSFYTPRLDFKCRRFANGIELIETGAGVALGVSFRKWGKLEAEGKLSLFPIGWASLIERLCGGFESALSQLWPMAAGRGLLVRAFNRAKQRGLASLGTAAADAFVIECVSETPQEVDFTLTIRPKLRQVAFFQKACTIAPGYNYISVDVREIAQKVDLAAEVLVQVEPLQVPAQNHFIFHFLDFARLKDSAAAQVVLPKIASASATKIAAAAPAAFCKCVVWDLDNTVWKGTLVEDGVENLKPDPRAVAAIHEFDRRGILQSIASKNSEAEALDALNRFGLREFFLYPKIHWGPKSGSIRAIAKQLNIGMDTFVFVDDQPFELAEVQTAMPMVTVVSATELDSLLQRPIFDVPITDESSRRRLMYREEAQRSVAAEQMGADFLAFLRSCQIQLTLAPLSNTNRERIFELTQRTNQLNYAGRGRSRQEIDALASDPRRRAYVMSCRDRFGDYGVIGFAVADMEAFEVEDFFMSCRVQHKLVDNAFFGMLQHAACAAGASALKVRFRATGRNEPARQALAEMGFTPGEKRDGTTIYTISRANPLANAEVVAVVDRSQPVATPALAIVEDV